ncbi:MAG: S8 family serine peptidase [Phycisphaerae bacterium]|jgi:subtilisin family serine protease
MSDLQMSWLRKGRFMPVWCLAVIVAGEGWAFATEGAPGPGEASKIHPTLLRELDKSRSRADVKAWVLFTDKGSASDKDLEGRLADLASDYNPRAIQRRQQRRTLPGLFDEHDLPVTPAYLDGVAATGVQLKRISKWVNGVSVLGNRKQFERIADLSFVRQVQPVRRGLEVKPTEVDDRPGRASTDKGVGWRAGGGFYGLSEEQLTQISLTAVHDQGFTGAGVVIGILDTGFQRSHVAFNEPGHLVNVIAEYDFIDDDADTSMEAGDPSGQHSHGTYILGTIGAYKPNELVGAAYDASFILCKTEDTTDEYEAEEDNYVAGLEFIESNGGDIATSSLSYIDWYTQDDLDGLTAVTTVAVNIATANGVHCCTAARNGGHDDDPATSTLGAPADAFQVLTCGAVDSFGGIASFSSDGPTADGRVKPEVLARGVDTQTVSSFSDTNYTGVGGTSLSTPLVAGAVACMVQAHPEWTVDELRSRLFDTADFFVAHGTFDPEYVRGYGIINVLAALNTEDCNNNGIDDGLDIANGTSEDSNDNGVPDECEDGACCVCGAGVGCQDITLFDCNDTGGFFVADEECAAVTCPPSTPPNDDSANATPVVDGDNALVTACATTDGPITETDGCVFDPPDRFTNDVWYDYVATCEGSLTISAPLSTFDVYAAVYCDDSETCSGPIDGSTEYGCGLVGTLPLTVLVNPGKCYRIRIGGLDGDTGLGTLSLTCEWWSCVVPDAPVPDPVVADLGFGTRNRFLSFQGGNGGGELEAVRVKFADLPPPFEALEGQSMWVGEPFDVSEASGSPFGPPPNLTVAMLQCEPHFTDWSVWGTVNVFAREIIPESTYELQMIDEFCAPRACFDIGEVAFSSPLTIHTSRWGDVAGDCSLTACTSPQGIVDFVDIAAVVDKFKNLEGAESKSRTDLTGDLPDLKIDFVDISHTVEAFTGSAYPFDGPTGCD